MILGLTGGMGCGKSTALRMFAELGFRPIDSDRIVREEVLVDPEVSAAIGTRFPGTVSPAGDVRRDVLATKVFAADGGPALQWLEELVLPCVLRRWRAKLDQAPTAKWVIESPLLFEKNLEKWFDYTICVAASSTSQLARLSERGLSATLARQRISRQLPLVKKIELADFVLSNDGTPDSLQQQVALLAARLGANRL